MATSNKGKTPWADRYSRPATATPPPPAPDATPRASTRVAKIAVTYRFEADVLDLIDQAVADAAAEGRRLTRQGAVENAIRLAYDSRP